VWQQQPEHCLPGEDPATNTKAQTSHELDIPAHCPTAGVLTVLAKVADTVAYAVLETYTSQGHTTGSMLTVVRCQQHAGRIVV
jgi:hypothetical protein